jgi:pimeloyl-ACP methyl ester carboxylesterase
MRKRGNFKPPIVIPGAGHAMAENPKAFNEEVLNFTSQHALAYWQSDLGGNPQ